MSLEEQIVVWSQGRPEWQRGILRRVATGESLSPEDYDSLVEDILASKATDGALFSLAHLPQAEAAAPSVTLLSVSSLEHVNALASNTHLSFQPTGLTLVYGDNGSGKSGYARILKRVTRSRHQEDVLTDVFRDTAVAKPTARLEIAIDGATPSSLDWPEASIPDLKRILYYDDACGRTYMSTESDFPYRPSALFVMDGLIAACTAVRARIDAKLEANAAKAKAPPEVNPSLLSTPAGKFIRQLTTNPSVPALDKLIEQFDSAPESVEALKAREQRLSDPAKERQRLDRHAAKVDTVAGHFKNLDALLDKAAVEALSKQRKQVDDFQEAAEVLAATFESEPIPGVGAAAWKELWESARKYSEEAAYPDSPFPVTGNESRCVLCQQPVTPEVRARFLSFEAFVQEDTQTKLRQAREAWKGATDSLTQLVCKPETVDGPLSDLDADHADLVREVRATLETYEAFQEELTLAISSAADLPQSHLISTQLRTQLEELAAADRAAAKQLADPEQLKKELAAATLKRQEQELLSVLKERRFELVKEIERLQERQKLEAAKNAAATGPITQKILQLSEDHITEVVRNAFVRESDRLQLERITLAKTRADRGSLFHQPQLVGLRQKVRLPSVFSEGEKTALGLAAFFTEAQLDASRSALILDDPVSSLDHVRRALVARRLAAFAEARQVIVFTHDVAFVEDLKREVEGLSVSIAERCIYRSRGGEKKPGTCATTLPWKAKDVAQRLNDLRQNLAQLKKNSAGWDQDEYERNVALWAGSLSETWERIFSQEIVGQILDEGGLQVRPAKVRILAKFSENDEAEFQASYSRVSLWAKRHDKSALVNYVAPEFRQLEEELQLVDQWFKRVKAYKS